MNQQQPHPPQLPQQKYEESSWQKPQLIVVGELKNLVLYGQGSENRADCDGLPPNAKPPWCR